MYNPLFPEMLCPQCRHKLTITEKTDETEKLHCGRCNYSAVVLPKSRRCLQVMLYFEKAGA